MIDEVRWRKAGKDGRREGRKEADREKEGKKGVWVSKRKEWWGSDEGRAGWRKTGNEKWREERIAG